MKALNSVVDLWACT